MKLNIADYPKMKKEDRSRLYRDMRDKAFPTSEFKTTKDLERFLNG